MNGKRTVVLFVVSTLLVVLAAGGATAVATTESPTATTVQDVLADDHVEPCAAEPPADHAAPDGDTEDVVGWVDGYWYDEPLDISGDELTQEELDELVPRTAARVEALRCLTFEEVPETEMVTRDDYRDDLEEQFEEEVTDSQRNFENARLATMLLVGQDEDAIEVQLENQAAFPAAFYDTQEEYMGFVTDDPDSIQLDQQTLAHELTHALQDQHYSIDRIFEEPTNDEFLSSLAVVEGDAVLTDGMYGENCDINAWNDDCVRYTPPFEEPPNWGLTLNQLVAYETPLVESTYEQEGWSGVNALLEEMPQSTVEAIYPERYGEFERTDLTVEDRSTENWDRITTEAEDGTEVSREIVGQSGLTAILAAPTYETGEEIIDMSEFVDPVTEEVDYGHTVTDGWESDALYTYHNDEGDLGSVWKLAWESDDDAETFTDAYESLIEYRGGERIDQNDRVYAFDGTDEYDMALSLELDDDRLWVVTAPTVGDLDEINAALDVDADVTEGEDDEPWETVDYVVMWAVTFTAGVVALAVAVTHL